MSSVKKPRRAESVKPIALYGSRISFRIRARAATAVLCAGAAALALAGCPQRDFDRAADLEAKGQLDEAGEIYVAIVKKDPANLPAWDHAVEVWCRKKVNVGECMNVLDLELDRLGNVERHHDALGEALELRARARIQQGLIDAALSDLTRAERASPQREGIFTAKARALVHLGKREEALQALHRARELDPKDEEIEELLKLLPNDGAKDDGEGFGGTKSGTAAAHPAPR